MARAGSHIAVGLFRAERQQILDIDERDHRAVDGGDGGAWSLAEHGMSERDNDPDVGLGTPRLGGGQPMQSGAVPSCAIEPVSAIVR